MDEDQEMENNFCEINHRKRKEKRILSKEDVYYGVSASASLDDDDDDEGASSRKRKKGLKSKVDLTKPVHFMSTETVMPNQETD